jgi:RNA polymerase sigma-70 factor (ECF subfamily)
VAEDEKSGAAREQFIRDAVAQLDHLYRVAVHLVAASDQADDLVQETYARAIGSYAQFTLGSNIKSWLTKILYNLFFDHYRESKRVISLDEMIVDGTDFLDDSPDPPLPYPGPEAYALSQELKTKIGDALRTIPEEFRVPLILVDMEDFSYAEAAQVLSCPLGTIRSRISRGRNMLRKRLVGYVGPGKR